MSGVLLDEATELSEAVPPAYTAFVGAALLEHLKVPA